jgi:hypothetical protein
MPQGARMSLKRYIEILMPGLAPGIGFLPPRWGACGEYARMLTRDPPGEIL